MQSEKELCFVIMPFASNSASAKVWEEVIINDVFSPTGRFGSRFDCVRADQILGSSPIMEDVRKYISNASLIIADLSNSNPNVYYELGIAHELNKLCIIIAHHDEIIPFDISHLRHLRFKTDINGIRTFSEQLKATLDDILREDIERDFGIARIISLEQERLALEERNEELQKIYVSIPQIARNSFKDLTVINLLRLHPGRNFSGMRNQFSGSYYSFTNTTHEYGQGSDISYRDGYFKVGFAGWDYGFFLELGEIDFSQLINENKATPLWLSSKYEEAWRYIFDHQPAFDEENVRMNQNNSRSLKLGNVKLGDSCTPKVKHSYLLRSISYQGKTIIDIAVALNIVTKLPDESLIVAWHTINHEEKQYR